MRSEITKTLKIGTNDLKLYLVVVVVVRFSDNLMKYYYTSIVVRIILF